MKFRVSCKNVSSRKSTSLLSCLDVNARGAAFALVPFVWFPFGDDILIGREFWKVCGALRREPGSRVHGASKFKLTLQISARRAAHELSQDPPRRSGPDTCC